MTKMNLPTPYFLKAGYLMANRDATLVRTVLGNCVAVAVFDRANRFGGMHHFVFPSTDQADRATPQYGNVGLPALFRTMLDMGAERESLVAQIIGGAECPCFDDESLGIKNVQVAREVLKRLSVPVVSEDTGGERGRKVVYHTGTNETAIFKVDNLRDNDWFRPGTDLRFVYDARS